MEVVAANAVMAGCAPEYMPVVLSALEALLENPAISTARKRRLTLLLRSSSSTDRLSMSSASTTVTTFSAPACAQTPRSAEP